MGSEMCIRDSKESGMAGCSVLGDGSITIILDMKEFLGNYDFRKGE